jgi:hypothetical protein
MSRPKRLRCADEKMHKAAAGDSCFLFLRKTADFSAFRSGEFRFLRTRFGTRQFVDFVRIARFAVDFERSALAFLIAERLSLAQLNSFLETAALINSKDCVTFL